MFFSFCNRMLVYVLLVVGCNESVSFASDKVPTDFDVLVYGSTPSGIIAAVASARHGAKTALLSQRPHIGGVCTGGLGQTDIGGCADEVIGGFTHEFFLRNAKAYATPQPRAPWNLEPHVARDVFLAMLNESGVTLLNPSQVLLVVNKVKAVVDHIQVEDGSLYSAKVFVDASYEGDLMARTTGVDYTYGREARQQYNESGAGSQGTLVQYGIEYIDPYDANGNLLPLLRPEVPLPVGEGDKQIQAYNFRLCVTDNASLRVPFRQPANYDPAQWELLRRFWLDWPNSTNPHKEAQAAVPTAILGGIPSTSGARKYDANNCGYNLVHTDMIGGSWEYPEANYSQRTEIWQAHVDYTEGFLWFMSSDASVPSDVRTKYAQTWGYCGDEFPETNHFPPQLYIREARRVVGDKVLTQNDVTDKVPLGNLSIGMGCYNFDSHCEERYACASKENCSLYSKPYVGVQCGCNLPNPGVYQMPLSLLFPKKEQVSNLLVSVCASSSHVAYATVRMEPQFMIIGHAAGVVAALTANLNGNVAVQDVDPDKVAALLLADGQIIAPTPQAPSYGCEIGTGSSEPRCLLFGKSHPGANASCSGECAPLASHQWLALRSHYGPPSPHNTTTLHSLHSTVLKKSETISGDLPAWALQNVGVPGSNESETLWLSSAVEIFDSNYFLVSCAQANCTAHP
eukprot:m.145111 g.145111  ORF g.145111 m.145111 type:complete len:683 (+) comp30417_c0_seq2:184-2232(+)